MVCRAAFALLLFAATSFSAGCATMSQGEGRLGSPPLAGGRLFRELSPIRTVELLLANIPGTVRMVEMDAEGHVVSDTLTVWVQHCAPRCVVPAEVQATADLILSCYPNGAPLWVRLQHVLPAAVGAVWVYDMGSYLYVSPGREPLYDAFLLLRNRPAAVRL